MASNDFKNSLKLLLTNIKDKHYTKKETELKLEEIKAIRDVEELPTENVNENVLYRVEEKSGWQGTPVPNTGYVENVYLNTNLSVEEVTNLVEQLTYDSDGWSIIFATLSESFGIAIIKNEKGYRIVNAVDETMYYNDIVDLETEVGFIGWNANITYPIVINEEATNYNNIGFENNLISSLFSTTPFVKIESKPQLYHFKNRVPYQLQEKVDFSHMVGQETITSESGWSGTVVPNSGYVEKVYLNTNLSVTEVVDLLNSIGSNELYIIASNDMSYILGATKDNVDYSNPDLYFWQIFDMNNIYFSEYSYSDGEGVVDYIGWNPNITYPLAINIEVVNVFNGVPFGANNDKLSSLVSITPFEMVKGNETTTLYQLKADGTLDKEKPINILSREDIIEIMNTEFENAEEGAY